MTAAATVVVDAPRLAISPARRGANLVPGVLLLGVIGYASRFTEQTIAAYGRAHHLALPNIEYVLWAIVFGLIVSNIVGVPRICEAGVGTYEFWLKTGIVLLGVRFVLGDVAKLGGVSLACVFVELVLSIAIMTALGRAFRLPIPGHLRARDRRRVFSRPVDRPGEPVPLGVPVQFRRHRSAHEPPRPVESGMATADRRRRRGSAPSRL